MALSRLLGQCCCLCCCCCHLEATCKCSQVEHCRRMQRLHIRGSQCSAYTAAGGGLSVLLCMVCHRLGGQQIVATSGRDQDVPQAVLTTFVQMQELCQRSPSVALANTFVDAPYNRTGFTLVATNSEEVLLGVLSCAARCSAGSKQCCTGLTAAVTRLSLRGSTR